MAVAFFHLGALSVEPVEGSMNLARGATCLALLIPPIGRIIRDEQINVLLTTLSVLACLIVVMGMSYAEGAILMLFPLCCYLLAAVFGAERRRALASD